MRRSLPPKSTCLAVLALGLGAPAAGATAPAKPPQAAPKAAAAQAGGREYGEDDPIVPLTVPGAVAQVVDGKAYAPAEAPEPVKQLIWAANAIVGMPYHYGGGHGSFTDSGYDCSGTVSFALHGADLLRRPRDSSSFLRYGQAGPGQWVSIYTRSSHVYLTVAGIRLDTSAADDPSGAKGARWRPVRPSDAGFKVRHPDGL